MIDRDYHSNIDNIKKRLNDIDAHLHAIDAICEAHPDKKGSVDGFVELVDGMIDNVDDYIRRVDTCLQTIEKYLYA